MARLSINQTVFPLLLPYSLKMEGVWLKEVREGHVDGRDVWVIAIPFSKGFFVNPVMETTWILVVAKDDYSIQSLEFAPAQAFADVSPVGVRYRILMQKDLEGPQCRADPGDRHQLAVPGERCEQGYQDRRKGAAVGPDALSEPGAARGPREED